MRRQKVKCSRGSLHRGQRIDHDPARARVDERDGGNIETAHLIDAIGNPEQAMPGQDFGMPPQAGIGALRRITLQKFIGREIERHPPVAAHDFRIVPCGYETLFGKCKIAPVIGGDETARLLQRGKIVGHRGAPSFIRHQPKGAGLVRLSRSLHYVT